ncbi:MAG TPA: membrane protein insertase YidC [Succinivibrionaceae bacterium]|nr:membrane protein insertase YidC [Succinivibrionaceae bacterium]
MEQQRNILLIILLCLTMFILWSWETDKANAGRIAEQQAANSEFSSEINSESTTGVGKIIHLKSDNLNLAIDLTGGDIVDARLLKIAQKQGESAPFHLLMNTSGFVYVAQSGLAGTDGPDSKGRPNYTSSQDEYVLEDGKNEVSATLTYEADGVTYEKVFTLSRDSYVVNVTYNIKNNTDKEQVVSFYAQLKQSEDDSVLREDESFGMVASAYRGTAYSSDDSRYEKSTLDTIIDGVNNSDRINISTKDGWVAMIQHYFVSAWIGSTEDDVKNVIYSGANGDKTQAIIGIRTDNTVIKANSEKTLSAKLWLGPKNQDQMETVAPHLDLTVDYGWLWFISIPLFKILQFFHSILGNWGFSIIALTLVVRSVMFPLTKAQYTSMAKMRLLTPKLQEIRERYGNDRQKLGQETMRLYKSEKVNPMGGCLPLFIQMPIFIALYWTLMESTELRQSSFILWITDLSVHDPFFVLPILYGVSMFFLQKMSPTPVSDPIQRKVFMAMPLVFTFMFCTFPAGLTLYWFVSNCFTIFQQTIIYRSLEKKGLSMKAPAKK